MPVLDGLEATRRIVGDRHLVGVRVLVLTTFEIDEYVFEALRAGASGFLLKDVEPDDLRAAVRVVAGGQSLLAPAVTRAGHRGAGRPAGPGAGRSPSASTCSQTASGRWWRSWPGACRTTRSAPS